MGVRVVTDSACDLPDELVDALRHRDRPAHDPLRRRGVRRPRWSSAPRSSGTGSRAPTVLPETAAPSAGAFEARFRGLIDRGRDRHRLHQPLVAPLGHDAGRAGRGQRRRATTARSRSSTRCTCSMGLGALCLTAARRAADGAALEEIVAEVHRPPRPHPALRRARHARVPQEGRPDRQRRGRCSARCCRSSRSSRCATASSRRPGKVRTRSKALQLLADKVRAQPIDNARRAARAGARRRRAPRPARRRSSPATRSSPASSGPVIGTHAGPGVIGVSFQVVAEPEPERAAARAPVAWPGDPSSATRAASSAAATGSISLIARGGMATVWVGRGRRCSARRVAVKTLHPELALDDGAARPVPPRGDRRGRLGHPNIVATYDTGEDDGVAYIVMELVDGPTPAPAARRARARSTRRRGAARSPARWPPRSTTRTATGIVHRDIKPANVLVPPEGPVKVTDFGIAKAAGGRRPHPHRHGRRHRALPRARAGRRAAPSTRAPTSTRVGLAALRDARRPPPVRRRHRDGGRDRRALDRSRRRRSATPRARRPADARRRWSRACLERDPDTAIPDARRRSRARSTPRRGRRDAPRRASSGAYAAAPAGRGSRRRHARAHGGRRRHRRRPRSPRRPTRACPGPTSAPTTAAAAPLGRPGRAPRARGARSPGYLVVRAVDGEDGSGGAPTPPRRARTRAIVAATDFDPDGDGSEHPEARRPRRRRRPRDRLVHRDVRDAAIGGLSPASASGVELAASRRRVARSRSTRRRRAGTPRSTSPTRRAPRSAVGSAGRVGHGPRHARAAHAATVDDRPGASCSGSRPLPSRRVTRPATAQVTEIRVG